MAHNTSTSHFPSLSLELQIHFLKYLLQTGQINVFRQVVRAYHTELSRYILILVKSESHEPDDFLKLNDPLLKGTTPTVSELRVQAYEQNVAKFGILPLDLADRPIRILNLTSFIMENSWVRGYQCDIEHALERALAKYGQPTALIVSGATTHMLQYVLKMSCKNSNIPFFVIDKSPRQNSTSPSNVYELDQTQTVWEFVSNPNRTFLDKLDSMLRAPSIRRTAEITNYSASGFRPLDLFNSHVSVQFKPGCHRSSSKASHLFMNKRCVSPALRLTYGQRLESLQVFYSGGKFPRIECSPLEGTGKDLKKGRLLAITNTDCLWNGCRVISTTCSHGIEHEKLPVMRFTSNITKFRYIGLPESVLRITSWKSAKSLIWQRSFTAEESYDEQYVIHCPKLEVLVISSVMKASHPVKVRFWCTNISELTVTGLQGSDTSWDVLRLLNLNNSNAYKSSLKSLKLSNSTAAHVNLEMPLRQVEPFSRKLEHLMITGYSAPWVWSWNGKTNFPNLTSLIIDITHIPFRDSPSGDKEVFLDFSDQFPKIVKLSLRARLQHYFRYGSGKDDEGIHLVIKTSMHLTVLSLSSSIKSKSLTLNGRGLVSEAWNISPVEALHQSGLFRELTLLALD